MEISGITPSDHRAFLLAGEQVSVRGTLAEGPSRVELPNDSNLGLSIDLPPARDAELSAGWTRRVVAVDGGQLTETALAFRRLPAFLVRWEATGSQPVEIPLEWTGGRSPVRLTLVGGDETGDMESREGESGSITLRPDPGDPAAVLVTPVDVPALTRQTLERRLDDPEGELRGWTDPGPVAADGRPLLTLDHGDGSCATPGLFRIVRDRLASGSLWRTEFGSREARASDIPSVARGLLASGLHEEAGELLASRLEEWDVRSRSGTESAPLLEAAARQVLWSGSPRLLDALPHGFVDTAVEAVRDRAERAAARDALTASLEGRALAAWIDALDDGGRTDRADEIRDRLGTDSGSRRGAAFDADTGEEWDRWRTALDRAAWGDPFDGAVFRPAACGAVTASLLFGLLGARAHAAFGRLILEPQIPADWTEASISSIRIGDARVTLSYQRSEGRHTFRLVPEGGRVPLNVVFSPRVAAQKIEEESVDGERAELDRVGRPGDMGVTLQLALDEVRTVTIETEPLRTEPPVPAEGDD